MADGALAQVLVLEAPRRLVVRELPLPNLGDDDALVRVALRAAAAAKEAGAGFVMVTGLGARDADRLALASKFGADLAVDVSADDPVVELTKALADVVVDVTAYRAALDLLVSGRCPFASLPRRCVGLDDAEDLLATIAGERDDVPRVHGALTP
jgi:alcohol dehydrogenase